MANNGNNVDKEFCNAFDAEGRTHGLPGSFVNHIDYGNLFVGHYSAGDIQYSGHYSVENVHLMYWKETNLDAAPTLLTVIIQEETCSFLIRRLLS